MKCSKRLARMVATLGKYYTADVIEIALSGAEMYALHRDGRQITPEDWDDYLNSLPLDADLRIVTSGYVEPLVQLMS